MLRIGEFSRLARVSVKALRLYDRLGLLKPARTDAFSGYRYYSGEQLPRLNAILALKDLGFSLGQVGRLLNEGLSRAQIRAMLELRRGEAERALKAEQERLARVEARLRRMDGEGGVPGSHEVVLKAMGPQRVASVRETLPAYSEVGRLFGELRAYAERHGVRPSAWVSVWHDEEYRDEDADGEAAFVADGPLPDDGRVRESLLPAVEHMAATVHHGPFDTIGVAYAALLAWIEGNGYRVAGPHREVYLSGGEQGNPDYVTEIQVPVEKAEGRERPA
ncbi:MerR family transcriptional regulator [Rubrobacter marinus]|uniref:MerR family transcriptional regulator n=1 Tax=Rubrobacter marinus TaxID=2653852 RepID=A0A6G8PZL5_9ACTN|nr:MerR family transcriptional regulator [Rubrobacter marinus]QIN79646.1 MerR family transcriptional regulator [Rubrobacter marinus]